VISAFNPPLKGEDSTGETLEILAVAIGPPRPGPDWCDTLFLVIRCDSDGWHGQAVSPEWLSISEVKVNP
jgi:hypothetical protein